MSRRRRGTSRNRRRRHRASGRRHRASGRRHRASSHSRRRRSRTAIGGTISSSYNNHQPRRRDNRERNTSNLDNIFVGEPDPNVPTIFDDLPRYNSKGEQQDSTEQAPRIRTLFGKKYLLPSDESVQRRQEFEEKKKQKRRERNAELPRRISQYDSTTGKINPVYLQELARQVELARKRGDDPTYLENRLNMLTVYNSSYNQPTVLPPEEQRRRRRGSTGKGATA